MGLHIVLAKSKLCTLEKLHIHLKKWSEVEHILVASSISELGYFLTTWHVDLLFLHQSLLEETLALLLPTFVVIAETPDANQVINAYIRGAKGYILEDVSEGGLGFIVHAVAQGKEQKFFLNADTTYELLREATDAFIPVTDISSLTPREQEILYLLHDGMLNKDIAKQLSIGETTVRTHVATIERKLNATRYEILKLRLPKSPINSS